RRRARAPLRHPEARRVEGAPGPHPPPGRLLRRAGTRLRHGAPASPRVRRGRVRAPHRPCARHLPEGRHLGRGAREARGAGALRRPRRLQDRGAGAVSVSRLVQLIWGPVRCSRPSGAAGQPTRGFRRARQTPSAGTSALALGLLALLAPPAGVRADDLLAEAAAADPGIEERVRLIAAHRLEGNGELLAPDVADLEARDEARRDAGLPPTGLADDARYLAAGLVPTRDAQREALHAVLEAHPDPLVRRLAAHEREALARYRALLEREPQTRDAPEIVRAIQRLGTKRAAALCADTLALAKKALDTNDLDHAAFYVHSAERIDGCADEAARPPARVNEARARRAAHEEAGRWPIDAPPQPTSADELSDYQSLLVATALADPGVMIEAAS